MILPQAQDERTPLLGAAALRQAQDERTLLLGAAEELQRQDIAPDDLDAQVRTLTIMAVIVLLAVAVMLVAIGAAIGMMVAGLGGC